MPIIPNYSRKHVYMHLLCSNYSHNAWSPVYIRHSKEHFATVQHLAPIANTHFTGNILESYGVANLLPQFEAHFLRYPLGHGHSCHSSWLGAPNHAVVTVPVLVEVLCELCGLTRPCFPNDYHHTVVANHTQ